MRLAVCIHLSRINPSNENSESPQSREPVGNTRVFLATLKLAWGHIAVSDNVIPHFRKRDSVTASHQNIMSHCQAVIVLLVGVMA